MRKLIDKWEIDTTGVLAWFEVDGFYLSYMAMDQYLSIPFLVG
jgi:hypothetical protein